MNGIAKMFKGMAAKHEARNADRQARRDAEIARQEAFAVQGTIGLTGMIILAAASNKYAREARKGLHPAQPQTRPSLQGLDM